MEENELTTNEAIENELTEIKEVEEVSNKVDETTDEITAEFSEVDDNVSIEKPREDKNAEFAEMRRKKEHKKQLQQADYDKGMLDAVDGINPFTGEKITDDADLNEYKIMKDIAKAGGDPVSDYRKFIKDKSRAESQELKQREEQQRRYEDDISEFQSKYPDKLKELTKDERFSIFARGKVGKMSLSSIYEDYIKFNDFVAKDAKSQAEKMYSNALSSTGSLSASDSESDKSYLDMSDAEFEKVYQKALNGGLSKR